MDVDDQGPDAIGDEAAPPPWRDPARGLQMLSTEHWSLLSSRALAWNETFARSGLYLTVLSASVVALALLSQATGFDGRFIAFTLVLMSVVYFIGVTTIVRLQQSIREDAVWLAGMNRIRHGYVELEPRLAHYLITSTHDDERGMLTSAGVPAGIRVNAAHLFVTTPGMLTVVNSAVAGAAVAAVVATAAGSWPLAIGAGGLVFAASVAVMIWSGFRTFISMRRTFASQFPGPTG